MAKNLGNTQDLVAVESVQGDAVILKDGSLRQIVMVGGINFSLKSQEEQDTITYAYQNFLNSIDFPIQTIIHSRKVNIENYLVLLDKRIKEEPSELLQNQIGEYKEFVSSFVRDNPIMTKTFLVVIPFFTVRIPDKKAVSGLFPFFGKKKVEEETPAPERDSEIEKNLEQLKQRTEQVVSGLQSIDLEVKVLNNEELVELFYNFYNPSTVEKEKAAGAQDGDKK